MNFFIVVFNSLFQLLQFGRQFLIRGKNLPQPHKSPHDCNIDIDSTFTFQNTGKHRHTLLRKSVRQIFAMTPPLTGV